MKVSEKESLRLLLVDDDFELCSMMQEFFLQMGHQLECAYNGQDGLARALQNGYDLIVLDVMLPVIGGFTLLQELRRRTDVPVILLTARVHRQDRIQGLNIGADDYLTKPFDPDELLARIRAVLRRTGRLPHDADSVRTFGDLEIHAQAREVRRGGQVVELTALEFNLLQLLIRAEGRIVTREEITRSLLERAATPYDRALDVHISHLRRKLENEGSLIQTIRGVGYVFTAEREPRV